MTEKVENNHFANLLWDQVKPLEEFSNNGLGSMSQISVCLKGFANAELECSKALKQLIAATEKEQKKILTKIPDRTMLNSWDKLVVVMQEVSNLHEHISNQVYQCKENIKQSTNELEAVNELNYKSIHQESSELQKKVAAMEKLQYAYEKRIKDVDASSAAYNKSLVEYEETKEKFKMMEQMNQNCIGAGTVNPVESAYKKSVKENEYKKAKIEQVKIDYEKKIKLDHDTILSYAKSIDEVNEFKKMFYTSTLPIRLDVNQTNKTIQKNDQAKRINLVRDELISLGTKLSDLVTNRNDTWVNIVKELNNIDVDGNYDTLVTKYRTGDLPPGDFSLVDLQETTKIKLLLKNRRPELDPEDTIMTLGIENEKKARKQAGDRIKYLNERLLDASKQIEAIDILIFAGENFEDLNYSKKQLILRVEGLKQRGEKLQLFLKKLDDVSAVMGKEVMFEVEVEEPVISAKEMKDVLPALPDLENMMNAS